MVLSQVTGNRSNYDRFAISVPARSLLGQGRRHFVAQMAGDETSLTRALYSAEKCKVTLYARKMFCFCSNSRFLLNKLEDSAKNNETLSYPLLQAWKIFGLMVLKPQKTLVNLYSRPREVGNYKVTTY